MEALSLGPLVFSGASTLFVSKKWPFYVTTFSTPAHLAVLLVPNMRSVRNTANAYSAWPYPPQRSTHELIQP